MLAKTGADCGLYRHLYMQDMQDMQEERISQLMRNTPCGVVVKAEVQAWSAQCTSLAERQMMLRVASESPPIILRFSRHDLYDREPA